MIDIKTFENKFQILSFKIKSNLLIHVCFYNVYHILNPFNTSWDDMILKMHLNFHTNSRPQSMIHFKSSLLYVWCIFIEFHHYVNIFIQVGNLN
jgi:hypothetical protein